MSLFRYKITKAFFIIFDACRNKQVSAALPPVSPQCQSAPLRFSTLLLHLAHVTLTLIARHASATSLSPLTCTRSTSLLQATALCATLHFMLDEGLSVVSGS